MRFLCVFRRSTDFFLRRADSKPRPTPRSRRRTALRRSRAIFSLPVRCKDYPRTSSSFPSSPVSADVPLPVLYLLSPLQGPRGRVLCERGSDTCRVESVITSDVTSFFVPIAHPQCAGCGSPIQNRLYEKRRPAQSRHGSRFPSSYRMRIIFFFRSKFVPAFSPRPEKRLMRPATSSPQLFFPMWCNG